MSQIAQIFQDYLDQKDVKYTYYAPEGERNEAMRISFSGKNKDSIVVTFFFDASGDSINVKSFSVAKVPAEKLMDCYVVLNELNAEYRWVKFYIDSDNEITVSGDAIVEPGSAADECMEILVRYINIVDEVYPRIMKVIWA